jgi:DNA-binding transcriptional regulator YdaS (Cro superfamily)
MDELEALLEACRLAGGQSALGRVCDRTQPSVWGWIHKKRRLPADRVLIVEARLGVPRHLLRPDIYPPELPARVTA